MARPTDFSRRPPLGHVMTRSLTILVEEHRRIEAEIERFRESMASGSLQIEYVRHVKELIAQHYRREEPFMLRLHEHEPRFADKLREQHAETLEIAERFEESLEAERLADVEYLASRFLAIAQHNMIEEERDAFPLFDHCFRAEQRRDSHG